MFCCKSRKGSFEITGKDNQAFSTSPNSDDNGQEKDPVFISKRPIKSESEKAVVQDKQARKISYDSKVYVMHSLETKELHKLEDEKSKHLGSQKDLIQEENKEKPPMNEELMTNHDTHDEVDDGITSKMRENDHPNVESRMSVIHEEGDGVDTPRIKENDHANVEAKISDVSRMSVISSQSHTFIITRVSETGSVSETIPEDLTLGTSKFEQNIHHNISENSKLEEEDVHDLGYHRLPKIGEGAPQFTATVLKENQVHQVSLSDYSDKYLVLVFFPLDFAAVCASEVLAFSQRHQDFRDAGCEILSCTTHSQAAVANWIDQGISKSNSNITGSIPILCDKNMAVTNNYGVLGQSDGLALRATFIIDTQQIIQYVSVNDHCVGRSVDEVLRIVQHLKHHQKHEDSNLVAIAT